MKSKKKTRKRKTSDPDLEHKMLMSAINDTTHEDILVKSILRNRTLKN